MLKIPTLCKGFLSKPVFITKPVFINKTGNNGHKVALNTVRNNRNDKTDKTVFSSKQCFLSPNRSQSGLILTTYLSCQTGHFDTNISKSGRSPVRHDDPDRIVSFDDLKPDDFDDFHDISSL